MNLIPLIQRRYQTTFNTEIEIR